MADVKGKDACMLKFNSDARLTSEEFVKVFKEFDKDGENTSVFNILYIR